MLKDTTKIEKPARCKRQLSLVILSLQLLCLLEGNH